MEYKLKFTGKLGSPDSFAANVESADDIIIMLTRGIYRYL